MKPLKETPFKKKAFFQVLSKQQQLQIQGGAKKDIIIIIEELTTG